MPTPIDRFRGLYAIVGPRPGASGDVHAETLAFARALLAGGARIVQLRDKQRTGRQLVETAAALTSLCREFGALCLVNDRLDIALAAGADGVHFGQDDLPVADARRVIARTGRTGFVVGLSTHDDAQVREARSLGVDYVGFGPVYGTQRKADALSARGLDALASAVVTAGAMPVVAIGGITADNVALVVRSGAAMAAVISDLEQCVDPTARAMQIGSFWR